jgi:hypothetical protein
LRSFALRASFFFLVLCWALVAAFCTSGASGKDTRFGVCGHLAQNARLISVQGALLSKLFRHQSPAGWYSAMLNLK